MTLTASTLITSAGPLAAKSAGAGNALAPFTVGAFLFGAALVSGPSDRMFEAWGRRGGFILGCGIGAVGGIVGALALQLGHKKMWYLVIVACFLIGVSQGVGQFLRFAATELCSRDDERARAVTLVLAGGIVAAFAGPQAAVQARTLGFFRVTYSGCFALVILANVVNFLIILLVRFKDVRKKSSKLDNDLTESLLSQEEQFSDDDTSETTETTSPPPMMKPMKKRTMLEILSQPRCACAVSVAALAHTAMVMVMSCLTLAMDAEGFSFQLTCLTLELHFTSMYAPGLLGSSTLIRTAGPYLAAVGGLGLYAACVAILLTGRSLVAFILGMSLCGVAWNLCFASSTVLLTQCYRPDEALTVQAVNDLIIFGLAGIGSFSSGYIYTALGWERLIFIVAGVMALFAIILTASLRIDGINRRCHVDDDDPLPLRDHPQYHPSSPGPTVSVTTVPIDDDDPS